MPFNQACRNNYIHRHTVTQHFILEPQGLYNTPPPNTSTDHSHISTHRWHPSQLLHLLQQLTRQIQVRVPTNSLNNYTIGSRVKLQSSINPIFEILPSLRKHPSLQTRTH
ncbi:hypothetical protein V8G54_009280 [Vigna mungo]|uniref:Uncharacterized protein n=1 Tax=Vigna mungo TaxID=3915 RepID=A0AAQ3NXR1_VIGMU